MYVKIHGTADYVAGNTQSCLDLVNYLEKEDEPKSLLDKEFFFSHEKDDIHPHLVIQTIDHNHKGLKSGDAKFYMVSVNPDQRELNHLAQIATGGKSIRDVSEMSHQQYQRYSNMIKDYSRKAMDVYATAFNRGLEGKDLVYFGKIEQQRYFNGMEKEVKLGNAKRGESKPGLQTHVHFIISRKDKTQKHSLSPHANSRGSKNHVLNGKKVILGFDRKAFKTTCEQLFDHVFNYQRDYKQSFAYYNLQSNGASKMAYAKYTKSTLRSANLVMKPEMAAKKKLLDTLEKVTNNLLPPELRTAKKITEKAVKIVKDIGTGLE